MRYEQAVSEESGERGRERGRLRDKRTAVFGCEFPLRNADEAGSRVGEEKSVQTDDCTH